MPHGTKRIKESRSVLIKGSLKGYFGLFDGFKPKIQMFFF